MTPHNQTFELRWPQTLIGRIMAGLIALSVMVAAFFFLIFVLIAAGTTVSVLYLRALWRRRQMRAHASQEIIEGEYSVESVAQSISQEKIPDTNALKSTKD